MEDRPSHSNLAHGIEIGYPSDKAPTNDGIEEVRGIVSIFEENGLRCCVLSEMALQYYGSSRLRNDWWLCLSNDQISEATNLLNARPETYVPSPVDTPWDHAGARSSWPRYKVIGFALCILLVPAEEVHFAIDRNDAIVRGKTRIPFPSLPAFVESLLESENILDLEDLVDAMDLRREWASDNGVVVSDKPYSERHNASPKDYWEHIHGSRIKRLGKKYDQKIYATRYRRHNERDPREAGWL